MSSTKKQGFTLVELVIVIVILGILAVTALPKFINISSNANEAVLRAMGGAIMSAANMVYTKAGIQDVRDEEVGQVDLKGDGITDIETRYGYPSGSRDNGVSKAMDSSFVSETLWSTDYNRTKFYVSLASFFWTSGEYVNQVPIVATNCYLIYNRAATAGEPATIDYFTSGC